MCPVYDSDALGVCDEDTEPGLATPSFESLLDFAQSTCCMGNPFFDQFMDVNQLFPALALMEIPETKTEVIKGAEVITSDSCLPDVVMVMTDDGSECSGVASPLSEIIDVVSLESGDATSTCSDLSEFASSPESFVDVVSVQEDVSDLSHEAMQSYTQECADPKPDEEVVEEQITVIQTSDLLSHLTQDLLDSPGAPIGTTVDDDTSIVDRASMTVDLDQLFTIPELLDNMTLPTVDLSSSRTDELLTTGNVGNKRSCSSHSSTSTVKKPKLAHKNTGTQIVKIPKGLDKQTVRRLKNNIASKNARASRKLKEQELFHQEEELEKSNAELRKTLEDLTRLTTHLRTVLVEKLSGGSSVG